jgi:hypothetical protein
MSSHWAGLRRECAALAAEGGGDLEFRRLHGGYAWSLRLTMPASPARVERRHVAGLGPNLGHSIQQDAESPLRVGFADGVKAA